MAEPFFGEIRMFSGTTVPQGWLPCDGRLMPIRGNQALFSLLGTSYGGDGQTTFGLPDLRGRVAMHRGGDVQFGQQGGEPAHTLTAGEMAPHEHALSASVAAPASGDPAGNVVAAAQVWSSSTTALTSLSGQSLATAGGGQPHENMQPYLALTFCIAVRGVFPDR
jgi:microcystin-dependent protein